MATPINDAAVEAAAYGGGAFPPFQTETFLSQLIWLALTFGFLYYMIVRVIAPRIAGIIETRQVTIARDLDTAATARRKAQAAGEAYEQAVADAKAKAQSLAQKTRDKLAAESEARRAKLEAELGERLAEAEETIAARKASAMANVRDIASDTATAIVERLIGTTPPAAAISAALDANRQN